MHQGCGARYWEALEEGRALFSWPDPRGESAPAADWLYCSVDCMPSRRYCQRPFGVESNFSLDTAGGDRGAGAAVKK